MRQAPICIKNANQNQVSKGVLQVIDLQRLTYDYERNVPRLDLNQITTNFVVITKLFVDSPTKR